MNQRFKALILFIRYLFDQIRQHNVFNLSSTLAFTTLLAFVPLFTVVFAFLSSLPIARDVAVDINHFVLTYFIPEIGPEIEEVLSGFIQNAMRMQLISFISLLVTALMLIATIDKAMHEIWHEARKRTALGSLFIYWLVLIITPLMLATSIAISSYVSTLKWFDEVPEQIGVMWTLILPWLSSTIGLTLLYQVIPSAAVKFRHALFGAMFAALLFELSKRLFSLYIAHFPVQEAIFGALAVFPLFLIWLFVAWLVVLLGAEVCHALGVSMRRWVISSPAQSRHPN